MGEFANSPGLSGYARKELPKNSPEKFFLTRVICGVLRINPLGLLSKLIVESPESIQQFVRPGSLPRSDHI